MIGQVGARIYNPMDLYGKKSVYVKQWNRPCAVAFLISMQFHALAQFINSGIFEYTAAEKSTKTFIDHVRN